MENTIDITNLSLEEQSSLMQEVIKLADNVKKVGTVDVRPIVVGDEDGNFYITLGDYYLQVKRASIIAFNNQGKRMTINLSKEDNIKVELPTEATKMKLKVNTFTK